MTPYEKLEEALRSPWIEYLNYYQFHRDKTGGRLVAQMYFRAIGFEWVDFDWWVYVVTCYPSNISMDETK